MKQESRTGQAENILQASTEEEENKRMLMFSFVFEFFSYKSDLWMEQGLQIACCNKN